MDLKKLFGDRKTKPQVSMIEAIKPLMEFRLADPDHPARQFIDEASQYADRIIQVSISENEGLILEGNTADAWPLVSAIDEALEKAPDDLALLVARSGALCCAMQFKTAEEIIDHVLSIYPEHFEARHRKDHWNEWVQLFQYPSWSITNKTLNPVMAELCRQPRSVQPVRDGLQIGIAIISPAKSSDFPNGLPSRIESKWVPVWSDTSYGPIIAHYTVIKDDPADPWRHEAFLPVCHSSHINPFEARWLIERLSRIPSCFIVLADGSDVIYNARYIFPDSLKSDLRIIADEYMRKPKWEFDPERFNKAIEWHMKYFAITSIH